MSVDELSPKCSCNRAGDCDAFKFFNGLKRFVLHLALRSAQAQADLPVGLVSGKTP